MSCTFNEMLLYEYLDDILDKDEKLMVNNHLSLCKECRKKLSEIKLFYYEIENMDDVIIPEDIASIRASVVNQAFTEDESLTRTAYSTITSNFKKTKEALENTPVVGSMLPSKEKTANLVKGVYGAGKKVYKATKKGKPVKEKKFKGFGGLI